MNGDVKANSLTTTGSINCGAISSTTKNTNNNTITSGAINCGAISSTTINTNNNNINCGTGTITGTSSGNAASADYAIQATEAVKSFRLKPYKDEWHQSTDNINRFYFASSSTTYFGSNNEYVFRAPDTFTDICKIDYMGQLTATMPVVTNTGTDYLGV